MSLRTLTDKKGVILGCKRGQLYYAQLDDLKYVGSEQMKNRVVLIIQNDKGNRYSSTVVVALATSLQNKRIDLPTHVSVYVERLGRRNLILTEQLRTIDKRRLIEYVGELSDEEMSKVDRGIIVSLGLSGEGFS